MLNEFHPGDIVSKGDTLYRVYERIQHIEGNNDSGYESILIISDSLDECRLFWPLEYVKKSGWDLRLVERSKDKSKIWQQRR